MSATEAFAKIVGESQFIGSRAKRFLIHLFDQAVTQKRDLKLSFSRNGEEALGREIVGGFRSMVQCLGYENFGKMLTAGGVNAVFICDTPSDDNDPDPYQVIILPFEELDEGTNLKADIAHVLEFDDEMVAAIEAIELPEVV